MKHIFTHFINHLVNFGLKKQIHPNSYLYRFIKKVMIAFDVIKIQSYAIKVPEFPKNAQNTPEEFTLHGFLVILASWNFLISHTDS